MKSSSKRIALAGVLSAAVFVVLYLETLIGAVSVAPPAILSFAFVLTLCLLDNFWYALVGGLILGLSSFAIAFMMGFEVFMNPLISIAPRVVMGLVAFFVFRLFSWLLRNKQSVFVREILPISIGAGFGILTNTTLVLSMMQVFKGILMTEQLVTLLTGLNFPLELASALILTPVLVRALRRALKFGPRRAVFGKLHSEKETNDISH